ncbi:hypothetical protein B0I35DRAFT_478914 [Stachybotrys elegans]|uniref:Uncharacterized protein n=1 Tax=Stachybotrys elegans TaxID=80388 RepID=A0A8K0SRA5_9HYPO|nr:hypothetical protein B0I35DRAFT_478914 [Stachybotrys elegans]
MKLELQVFEDWAWDFEFDEWIRHLEVPPDACNYGGKATSRTHCQEQLPAVENGKMPARLGH